MIGAELQRNNYVDAATGANISFHSIHWNRGSKQSSIPTGGNLVFHTIPVKGTRQHTHEFAEVILILSGSIRHVVNGEPCKLHAGNLVFIRPSDVHCFQPIDRTPCELVNFAFSLELLLSLSKYVENDSFMHRFTAPVLPPSFELSRADADEMGSQLLRLNSGGLEPISVTKIKIKIILADLFTKFFLEETYILQEQQIPDWLEELCIEMQHPENFIKGLKRMQKISCCTPEHLCKSFRKYLNRTPTEFINELRINYAARQLIESRDEIMGIAIDLNFKSLSRFYHLFKKYYGVSPAKYRRQSRQKNKVF